MLWLVVARLTVYCKRAALALLAGVAVIAAALMLSRWQVTGYLHSLAASHDAGFAGDSYAAVVHVKALAWILAGLVFAAVYYLQLRWRERRGGR